MNRGRMNVVVHRSARGSVVKRKTYTVEQAQAFAQTLAALPQKPKDATMKRDLVAAEVVRITRKEIRAALAKGYSFEEIVSAAKTEGFDLGTPTLKKYLRTATKPPGKRRGAEKKTSDGTNQDAAAPQPPTATKRHVLPPVGDL